MQCKKVRLCYISRISTEATCEWICNKFGTVVHWFMIYLLLRIDARQSCQTHDETTVASQVSLNRPTTSSQDLNHDRRSFAVAGPSLWNSLPAALEMTAHFQETTEGLSIPHLMCWRTEGTFTTARHCCGVSWFWRRIQNCRLTCSHVHLVHRFAKRKNNAHNWLDTVALAK